MKIRMIGPCVIVATMQAASAMSEETTERQTQDASKHEAHVAEATGEGGHAHFCDPATAQATPILSVADFDGDGIVVETDILRLDDQIESGDYIAFFDRDANGRLDGQDMELALSDVGARSSPLDQQLAQAYLHTNHYRDFAEALAAGYIPYTGIAKGHGVHWGQHPESGALGYSFMPGNPFGLNFDADGALWGVFYYIGPSNHRPDGSRFPPGHEFRFGAGAPDGFSGAEDVWHYHAGICLSGVSAVEPTINYESVIFKERLAPSECLSNIPEVGIRPVDGTRWIPQLHMVHAWLYELNPCGTFAGAHPGLAPQETNPAEAIIHDVSPQDPHPEFDFAGGTMCSWLSEIGEPPQECRQ